MGAARPFRQAGENGLTRIATAKSGRSAPREAGPSCPPRPWSRPPARPTSGAGSRRRRRPAPARGRADAPLGGAATPPGSGRGAGGRSHGDGVDVRACSPPFFVSLEKGRDRCLRSTQGLGPRVEDAAALGGELIDALRGTRLVVAPLGGDEAL